MPGLQPIPVNITAEEWKDAKPQLMRALNYLIKDMYNWIGRIQGIETGDEAFALADHTHKATAQGGDYSWADLASGESGSVTIMTAIREGGNPLRMQYKYRTLTVTLGVISTIGAESAWTDVEFGE